MTQPTTEARAALASLIGYEPGEHDALFESHLDALVAAVRREDADEAERENAECPVTTAGRPCPPCAARAAVAAKLRRMAEEARS